MATNADFQNILATYSSRQADFLLDESSSELGQKNENDEDYNRSKIMQRDLANLSVISSLSKVQYGQWAGKEASLIGFRFQFQSANATLSRFKKAQILIEFQSRPTGPPDGDPVVLSYGPKKVQSAGTLEDRSWHCSVALWANACVTPVGGGPELEFGKEGNYARQYATVIKSDDWGNRKHRKPNCVKIWMSEDEKQKDGIPLELLAAVVIQATGPSQAKVSVRVGSVFQLLAQPWSEDDPVLLQPNVGFGTPIRGDSAPVDFSTMTNEEWRQLVTHDLQQRNIISTT
ncbi:hypothetical protein BT69DRAFT_1316221 [Atractiella rhizophila]|nr:hypothetical protein BT69DRAFT_1316221 [Atractiella rhizophila]